MIADHTEETAKAWFHMALGALAASAFCYNLIACRCRPRRGLVFNTLTYGALALLEGRQVTHHLRDAS